MATSATHHPADGAHEKPRYVQTVTESLPIMSGLILVLSACGGGGDEKAATGGPFVRTLYVQADYGQIYIYDPETQVGEWDAIRDQNDSPLFRAMDDGSASRRFVGYDSGLIDLITPSQYNWKAPMRVEVSQAPPPLDTDQWDHVVEVPLPVPSGRLYFEASGGSEPIETQLPSGTYRARLSGRGYVAGAGEIEGHESYRLQVWPAEEADPVLVKYWPGYDVMRPDG
jgi:hypothetical protein